MTDPSAHLLSLLTLAPAAAGLLLVGLTALASSFGWALPVRVWRVVGLVASGLTLLVSLELWRGYDPTRVEYQFLERVPWVPELGISYVAGIDGISLLLILLTTFLVPLVLAARGDHADRAPRAWIFFVLLLESGLVGTFAALHLVQLFAFWELVLVASALMVGVWGGEGRLVVAPRLLVMTFLGGALLWMTTLVVGDLHAQQFGHPGFDLVAANADVASLLSTVIPTEGVWWRTQSWLFGACALGFALRTALVPFHGWWTAIQSTAPTGAAILLGAPLLSIGVYGFLRVALPLFPAAALAFAPAALVGALLGVVFAAVLAHAQRDLRGLVALLAVVHLGVAMLGVFALNVEGMEGAVLQLVNLGLSLAALLFLIGMLARRRGTHEIGAFGGIAKPMPVFAFLFGVAALSGIGVPMLNGFVSEFLVLLGAFQSDAWVGLLAAAGLVAAACAVMQVLSRVLFGPVENPQNRGLIDLDARERAILVVLIVPILWIGIHPETFLKRLHPSVLELLRVMEERTFDLEVRPEGLSHARMDAEDTARFVP